MAKDTIVFTWGILNPPTKHHENLINRVKREAGSRKADGAVYLSHQYDRSKHFLTYKDKILFAQNAFGPIVKQTGLKTVPDILAMLKKKGYTKVYAVVPSDKVASFRKIFERVGKKLKFEDSIVINAGERDVDESQMGAKVRELSKQGNLEEFGEHLPSNLSPGDKRKLFNKMRLRMQNAAPVIKTKREARPKEWKGKMLWRVVYFVKGKKIDRIVPTRAAGDEKDAIAVAKRKDPSGVDFTVKQMGIQEANIIRLRTRHERERERLRKQHARQKENEMREKERMKAKHDAQMDRARTVRTDRINDSIEITRRDLDLFVEFTDFDALDAEEFPLFEDFLTDERKPLTVVQRMKRGRIMKRLQPRLQRKRKMLAKKMATTDKLKKRSRKGAIKILRKKFAGKMGQNYGQLGAGGKMMVDKLIAKRSGHLEKISKKLLPKVRMKEVERLKKAKEAK